MKTSKPATEEEKSIRRKVLRLRATILVLPILSATVTFLTIFTLKNELHFFDFSNNPPESAIAPSEISTTENKTEEISEDKPEQSKTPENPEVPAEEPDTTPPIINLSGYDTIYVMVGENFKDPGYSATDDRDPIVKVIAKGSVNTKQVGTYTLTYHATDTSGNTSTRTRAVKVFEPKAPATTNPGKKTIYLTFDDGPGQFTEQLLNTLAKYDIKATFFVTNQFSKYQYLIKREADAGHTIGIHSFSHQYANIYSSIENYFDDFNKMDEIIFNQAGIHTKIIRFPGGSSNTVRAAKRGIMTALAAETSARGLQYFDWNVASNDTGTTSTSVIYNNVVRGIKSHDYSIVLQHDIKRASVNAVEDIIRFGLAEGYTFLPLNESSPTAHHHINN